jgi:sugar/nucleoside kinase (ribokinase family)
VDKQCFDVLAVGDACLDVIVTDLDNEIKEHEIVHGECAQVLPGGGFTTPATLHRLGVKVTWAADFGWDQISKYIYSEIVNEGMDLTYSKVVNRDLQRISVSLSKEANRSFLSYQDKSPFLPAAFTGIMNASAKVVYMPGSLFGWMFDIGAFIARKRGMKIVVDGNGVERYVIRQSKVKRALRKMDVFILNAAEACHLTEMDDIEQAMKVLGRYCKQIVIKNGKKGALALKKGEIIAVPAIPITAVDTTGAGDCFNAGYIASWLWGLDLKECLQRANIVAGLSTTVAGGAAKIISNDNVQYWMDKYYSQMRENCNASTN